tara:strand:+ start:346 stop:1080 length:735 start_codon:yes stop_codon:yes gene_type:complete
MEWFKFPVTKWLLPKFQRLSAKAKADYMNLCCMYWYQEGELTIEDANENADLESLRKVIEVNDGMIHIDFLREQLEQNKIIKERRKIAGAKGGTAKAKKMKTNAKQNVANAKQNVASAKQDVANAKQIIAEKRRVDKNRVDKNRIEKIKEQISFPFSDSFLPIWNLWKDYKQEQHKFKFASSKSEQAQLNMLVKYSDGNEQTAQEIIEYSMANGYKGLFEPKTKTNEKTRFDPNKLQNIITHKY